MLNTPNEIKNFGLDLLSCYWGERGKTIRELPIRQSMNNTLMLPVTLTEVVLPDWALHCGIEGQILVPTEVVSLGASWQDIDWWYVIHWFTNCLAEREFERQHGPINSYSYKLTGWDERMWEHAWVNRIAMFLYCWASYLAERPNTIGPKPIPAVLVTHDLDAISKTKAIRFKQAAFHAFNALKALKGLKFSLFANKLSRAIVFFFRKESYLYLHKLNEGTNSPLISRKIINIYGGELGYKRPFKELLIDPSYDVNNAELVSALIALEGQNYEFGLHQSFKAWQDCDLMLNQKKRVSQALNREVKTCRQHWLRFSFSATWIAQYKAGFKEDTTLGFNDRIGFRNGLALAFNLKAIDSRFKSGFSALPMVLMDSHLYDYSELTEAERKNTIVKIVDEIIYVGGTVSVIWHPHTLGQDYGWESGYRTLLQVLRERI
jgi:hypothetical protein